MTQAVAGQDAGLIASAAAGDEIAFRRLIAQHREDMRRVTIDIAADGAVWVLADKDEGKDLYVITPEAVAGTA